MSLKAAMNRHSGPNVGYAAELGATLDTEIDAIPTVIGVRTSIVLKSILEGPPLSGAPIFAEPTGESDAIEVDPAPT